MTGRLAAAFVAVVTLNFVWAAGLVILFKVGLASAWILCLFPLAPIGCAAICIWAVPAHYPRAKREGAASSAPTAPVSLHAPISLPAPARDHVHRPADLLARDGR